MADRDDDRIKNAYIEEKRKARGLSDSNLDERIAELQATLDRATRDYVAALEKSVANGAMSAQDAAEKFAAFKRELDNLKVQFGPN